MMRPPIASLPSQSPIARLQNGHEHDSKFLTASGEMAAIDFYNQNQNYNEEQYDQSDHDNEEENLQRIENQDQLQNHNLTASHFMNEI